jgi:hypothetical protein
VSFLTPFPNAVPEILPRPTQTANARNRDKLQQRATDFLDRVITLDMGDDCADSRPRNGDATFRPKLSSGSSNLSGGVESSDRLTSYLTSCIILNRVRFLEDEVATTGRESAL